MELGVGFGLAERLAYWQKVLRLQDWDVEAEIVRGYDFDRPGTMGDCDPFYPKRYAKIRLRDYRDHDPVRRPIRGEGQSYYENILVHELLHIYLEALEPEEDSAEARVHEQTIDAVACALVALDERAG